MKEYSIQDVMGTARPTLGDDVPLVLFRILRIVGMRNLLGEKPPDRPSTPWESRSATWLGRGRWKTSRRPSGTSG